MKDFIPTEGKDQTSKEEKLQPVLTAIDAALGLAIASTEKKATVTFHSDSGLLMVSGSDRETSVVDQVLQAMRTARAPGKDEVRQLRKQLQKFEEAFAKREKNAVAGKESKK